jgi:hypothetical protein
MSARRLSIRCRIGLHAWEDVACADGRYLRRCTVCREEREPVPRYERQPPPRDDPRVREDPHGYGF